MRWRGWLCAALSLLLLQQLHAQSQAVPDPVPAPTAAEQTAAETDAKATVETAVTAAQTQQRSQAIQWLERMALAIEQLNYHGSFVYQQGDGVRLLRIEHHRDHRGVRERLYSQDNQQLEILRNNNLVQASSPANQTEPILSYSQFTRLPASHLLRDSSHYRFELGGEHDVAGYRAQHIAIIPRDSLRYGYAYWLEIRTGMLLKQQLLGASGEVLEMLLFTDIQLGQPGAGEVLAGPVLPAQQRQAASGLLIGSSNVAAEQGLPRQPRSDPAAADAALLQSSAHAQVGAFAGLASSSVWSGDGDAELAAAAANPTLPDRPNWQCVNPPRGYSLVAHQQSRQHNGALLDHLLYSDGLSQISVYIEQRRTVADPRASSDNELSASRVGVMNVYRRQLDNVSITALGAAPYRTLRMLGGSMARLGNSNDADSGEPARAAAAQQH